MCTVIVCFPLGGGYINIAVFYKGLIGIGISFFLTVSWELYIEWQAAPRELGPFHCTHVLH